MLRYNLINRLLSASYSSFAGIRRTDVTNVRQFIYPEELPAIPVYRIMKTDGQLELDEGEKESDLIDKKSARKIYKNMTLLNTMDKVLFDTQRQGRISFYMTSYGEEGTHIGSASALAPNDLIFAQYREAGVLLYRGFSIIDMMNQCFGNDHDPAKGRQMPVHYGSREHSFVMISSTLSTQLPQAVGAAYAIKRKNEDRCVVAYFGEGAASEGDAHAALNFASTLECPIIFFCRNNGYAISTPSEEQYRGDGIAGRGIAYGMLTIRVDGNDVLGVRSAMKEARHLTITQNRPVLIEAMTYRIGHHSTSDDSLAYRSVDEINLYSDRDHPIERFKKYLINKKWWNDEEEKEWMNETKKIVRKSFTEAEKVPLTNINDAVFEQVYDELHPRLQVQKKEFIEHFHKYGEHYDLSRHKK